MRRSLCFGTAAGADREGEVRHRHGDGDAGGARCGGGEAGGSCIIRCNGVCTDGERRGAEGSLAGRLERAHPE
jgi:hypothetical protein